MESGGTRLFADIIMELTTQGDISRREESRLRALVDPLLRRLRLTKE